MYVCIKFHPRGGAAAAASPEEIPGRHWSLTVTKSLSEGPWYPTVEEHADEAGYRLFAGRLTQHKAGDPLPAGLNLTAGAAADWRLDGGEPDGSWLALKFDRRNDEVSITADQWVHQRWFYTQRGEDWYFANSLLFLRRIAGGDLRIERRALPYLMVFGYLPGRITPLKGVSSLLPGEVITVSRGQMRSTSRTQLPVKRSLTGQTPRDISPQAWSEYTAQILGTIQEAVRNELEGVSEIVLPLSGGMDSRFMLGCALDVLPRERILTYTFGDPRTLDQKIAKALCRKLGLENVTVAMDRRPIDEACADGFMHSEGMTFALPNTPLGTDRRAVHKPGTYVLSGILGDVAFGSRDVNDRDPTHNTDDFLFKRVLAHGYAKEALPLLAAPHWDEMGYERQVRATPGESLIERFDRWAYGTHWVGRLSYHIFVFRDRAFYLAPCIERKVWDLSLTLPEAVRQRQRGYFEAMKLGYPQLHAYPTARNMGLAPGLQSRPLRALLRAWYGTLNALDDGLWKATGRTWYFDPRQFYGHRHELQQPSYRAAIEECIAYLKKTPAFDPRGLDALLARYRGRQPISTHILRGLLTAREWERRYA